MNSQNKKEEKRKKQTNAKYIIFSSSSFFTSYGPSSSAGWNETKQNKNNKNRLLRHNNRNTFIFSKASMMTYMHVACWCCCLLLCRCVAHDGRSCTSWPQAGGPSEIGFLCRPGRAHSDWLHWLIYWYIDCLTFNQPTPTRRLFGRGHNGTITTRKNHILFCKIKQQQHAWIHPWHWIDCPLSLCNADKQHTWRSSAWIVVMGSRSISSRMARLIASPIVISPFFALPWNRPNIKNIYIHIQKINKRIDSYNIHHKR